MTRNQFLLIVALIILLLLMAVLIVVLSDQVIGMMTPHPIWTGWQTPTREGTIEIR